MKQYVNGYAPSVWDWVHPDIDEMLRRAVGVPVEDDSDWLERLNETRQIGSYEPGEPRN